MPDGARFLPETMVNAPEEFKHDQALKKKKKFKPSKSSKGKGHPKTGFREFFGAQILIHRYCLQWKQSINCILCGQ